MQQISARLPERLVQRLDAWAADNARSRNKALELVLDSALDDLGYGPGPTPGSRRPAPTGADQ